MESSIQSPKSSKSPRATSPSTKARISKRVRHKRRNDDINLPQCLKDSDASASEDELPAQVRPQMMNMNQSIFGFIATAGSKVDFNKRFDDNSSSEEDGDEDGDEDKDEDDDDDEQVEDGKQQSSAESKVSTLAQTSILKPEEKREAKGRHRRRLSHHRLLKSLPTLPKLRTKSRSSSKQLATAAKETEEQNPSETSTVSSPTPTVKLTRVNTNRLAPVMSRMLEARAEVSSRPSFDLPRGVESDSKKFGKDATPLALRLMEIFEFKEPEHVIEEYPCWLLQSVLLHGFLYITTKHICFYAYLPKKANVVAKSGFLAKSGKRNPAYNRYWFRLKGDVLSYYRDSSNLYFPYGQIDLGYGISAAVTDRDKEGVHFEVVTCHRTYHFKADSAPSAKEWVKSLQRVIFRSHNDGDSVKISLPIENVMDIEESPMMEFADTCKVRVIDNDETYAIDEYFFSFFEFGQEAMELLKKLVEKSPPAMRRLEKSMIESHGSIGPASPHAGSQSSSPVPDNDQSNNSGSAMKLPEPVRATLPPMSPLLQPMSASSRSPGGSGDMSRRSSRECLKHRSSKSLDVASNSQGGSPRRSFSGSRRSSSQRVVKGDRTPRNSTPSGSNGQSPLEDQSFSNIGSSTFEDPSASNILNDSDVFHPASPSREMKRTSQDADQSLSLSTQDLATASEAEEFGQNAPTPTLQSLTKMGAYPLQRAAGFADYLNRTRQRMGSVIATESMGYVEKVSGMWKGGHRHYNEPDGLKVHEGEVNQESDENTRSSNQRFRAHFALPEGERLRASYFGYIFRVLPLYGKVYLSDRSFCFRSLLPGTRTKLILPLEDVENVHKEKGFRFGYSGLVVVIKGHEELFFEFTAAEHRDDCAVTVLRSLDNIRRLKEAGLLHAEEEADEDNALAERDALKIARQEEFPEHEIRLPRRNTGLPYAPPILDESDGLLVDFKPKAPMKITCLTIGSRGDVQPYIALCKGLIAQGHKPRIATHAEFQPWIESHGIEFARVEGDPAELMRLCIEHGTFTWAFLREANSTFRGWLGELLESATVACEGSDLLIESPSAMAGIHIAEKMGIPYFRAFTMPWTRTRAYPHAFIFPEHKLGGSYNILTYSMFDNVFWKAISRQVNRWRNNTLGLPNTNQEKLQQNKVPFLYNFSPSVVVPPLDFSDWIRVTGYWFLDEGEKYEPPNDLKAFIQQARDDGKKIVYVGFGSIIVNDPVKMTQEVIDAVLKADVRCILSKGWSDRVSSKALVDATKPPAAEPKMPPEIYVISSAPHDWLFSQIDAAAHHGGSGTTGASLRAGIPTIIRPFFGDQFFFASRVEDLGVGVWVRKWGTNAFGRALWEATRNDRMIAKARALGGEIRRDNGVDTAIQSIYRDLEYATSLIKLKAGKNTPSDDADYANDGEENEESWTFVGNDDPDSEFSKALDDNFAGLKIGA